MQTPLMELIEWIKNGDDGLLWTQQDITEKATELLEKERDVIIDSYNYGRYDGEDGNISQFKSGQDYFTKTFTEKKD